MINKQVLLPDRVRRPPREGFSWVDRRFLREYACKLTGDAILLYFFLAAVSDKHGLSFYSDTSIAVRLRMREEHVVAAREDLLTHDLVAFQLAAHPSPVVATWSCAARWTCMGCKRCWSTWMINKLLGVEYESVAMG